MNEITRVFDADDYLGESPIWSIEEQKLWWVNCEKPAELRCWSPATSAHRRWTMPGRIGGFVPKASGGHVVVLADGLYDFDDVSGRVTLRVASPLPSGVALHECHCDRQGRLWVGAYDHRYPGDRAACAGKYFRLDGSTLTPMVEDVAIANGLAFSPDGRTLYASGAMTRQVEAFDIDPKSGSLSNRRAFVVLGDGDGGYIDGATIDTEGGYWLAMVGAAQLRRYRPDGALDKIIALPFSNPTKPAFGGPDLKTLYITSTQMKINPDLPGFDANGGIFAFRPGEAGVPESPLASD